MANNSIREKKHGISWLGIFAIIGIVLAIVALLYSIMTCKYYIAVISIAQIIGFIIVLLAEINVIKIKSSIIIIVCSFCILMFIGSVSINLTVYKDYVLWKDLELSEFLPKPPSFTGTVYADTSDDLVVDLERVTSKEYESYVEKCKESGYSVDAEKKSDSYVAFSKKGYKLTLDYSEYSSSLDVNLEKSEELVDIKWPDKGLATFIPAPRVKKGKIEENTSERLSVLLGNCSIEKFNEYADECIEEGYNKTQERTEKRFFARNADGYPLTVEYIGNNVSRVIIEEKEYKITLSVSRKTDIEKCVLDIFVDCETVGTVKGGTIGKYVIYLKKGIHKIKISCQEDNDASTEREFRINKAGKISFKANCFETGINIFKFTNTAWKKNKNSNTNSSSDTGTKVIYSTNTREAAKQGNSGRFAYVNKGQEYTNYRIIDFDQGYVYSFTDGNGNDECERTRIESGDLNNGIATVFHYGEDDVTYYLHFKYKNSPERLIEEENNFKTEFKATDLAKAESIRGLREIKDY